MPPWYNPCNPDPNSSPTDTLVYSCQSDTSGVAVDTYFPISPQQFVYIPNIYLVPKDTTDLIEYWTYLTNQFSINQYLDGNNNPQLGLQLFRTKIDVNVDYDAGTAIIYDYFASTNIFPIAPKSSTYPDTQFLSYTNMPNAVVTGISPLSGGCSSISTSKSFGSNIYNPIVPANTLLLFNSTSS